MKKFLTAFGIVILCLAVVSGGLIYWQRDQIKALVLGLKYSNEELSEMVFSAQNELKKAVESYSGTELRDYTEEELKQIESGEVTSGEIIAKIINEAVNKKLAQNDIGHKNASAEKSVDTIINEHVSKLYSLKSSYIGQIDAIIAQGAAEYYALVDQGKGSNAKQSLLPKYLNQLAGLESACDSEVAAIISSLTNELKARNHSLDIIESIRSTYANEKRIKKAQLIKMYS